MINIQDISEQLPRHPTKSYNTRAVSQIEFIVAHHSGTTSGDPWSFAKYHVDDADHQWPGIGYHFVIAKDGTVWQTNMLATVSYHCSGVNTKSIGICMVGNFDIEEPTTAQIMSFRELVKMHGLPVYGHRDFANRTCPGKNVDLVELIPEATGNGAGSVYASSQASRPMFPTWKRNLYSLFENGEGGDGAIKANTAILCTVALLLLLILAILFSPSSSVDE